MSRLFRVVKVGDCYFVTTMKRIRADWILIDEYDDSYRAVMMCANMNLIIEENELRETEKRMGSNQLELKLQ